MGGVLQIRTRDFFSSPLVAFLTIQIIKILHNVFETDSREHTVSTASKHSM